MNTTRVLSDLMVTMIDFADDPHSTSTASAVADAISRVRAMSCDENLTISQIDAIFTAMVDGRYADMTDSIEALLLNIEIANMPIDASVAHELGKTLVTQWYQHQRQEEPMAISNEDLVNHLIEAAEKKNMPLITRLRQQIIERSADQVAAARDCDRLIDASTGPRSDDIVPSAAADILDDMGDES